MRPFLIATAVLPISATVVFGQAGFRMDNHNLALTCTPQFATAHGYKDPITDIRVRLTPNGASIIHDARSGASYNRTDQYVQESAQWRGQNFIWRGIRLSNPRIAMTGVVELGPNGYYTYRESQFDAGLGGRKTYDMVSLCVESGVSVSPPKQPNIVPKPPLAPPAPFQAEKERMVQIMNEQLVACADPKLSELVKSGEVAAELTDATMAFCREAVDDLIGAEVI